MIILDDETDDKKYLKSWLENKNGFERPDEIDYLKSNFSVIRLEPADLYYGDDGGFLVLDKPTLYWSEKVKGSRFCLDFCVFEIDSGSEKDPNLSRIIHGTLEGEYLIQSWLQSVYFVNTENVYNPNGHLLISAFTELLKIIEFDDFIAG
jgi:hypothetical protein